MKKTILFIEPDIYVREAVILLLGEKGNFIEVSSLREGFELLQETSVHMILSHEFGSEILKYQIPVVIFSAKLGLNEEDLLNQGVLRFFSKIHDWNFFLDFLNNYL